MSVKLVSTGKIIQMYLDEYDDLSAVKLAEASGVSLRSILRVLSDETPLSFDVALGMNKLLPELSAEYLMSYDAQYQLQKKRIERENNGLDITKCVQQYKMKKIYRGNANDETYMFERCKKIFGINNILNHYNIDISDISFCYSSAKNPSEREQLVWLRTTYYEYNEEYGDNKLVFNRDVFDASFENMKALTSTNDIVSTIYNMKAFCKRCGINFYYRPSITNARIKAVAVKDKDGYIYIFVSDLFKCIENLWIAFVHECMHIKNDDFDKVDRIKFGSSEEVDEKYIDDEAMKYFVQYDFDSTKTYSINDLLILSKDNNSPFPIVVEIMRYKCNVYNNQDFNRFIHYYDSNKLAGCCSE